MIHTITNKQNKPGIETQASESYFKKIDSVETEIVPDL